MARTRWSSRGSPPATTLWNRIYASREAGKSVQLPPADPRRPASPVLVGALVVAAVVAIGTLLHRDVPPAAPIQAGVFDDAAVFDWLATPAYAQTNGTSALPPIDPPDLAKLTPRRLVYQHAGGADGIITQQEGTDTLGVARETVDGASRVVLSRTDRKGNPYGDTRSLDSLALADDGHMLFWRWQVSNLRKNRSVTVSTTLETDSVRFTYVRNDGLPTKVRVRPGNYEYQMREVLLALLPALPFELGYARSVSVMDLVRGETTAGFSRSVEMRVTGKTWVNVPIGRFHCWVVDYSVVPEAGEKRYTSRLYVDIESGSLVRAEWKTGESFIAEQFLVDWQVSR